MRTLAIAFVLILQSFISFSQKEYKVSLQTSVEGFITEGNITDNRYVIDGYAKNGFSNNLSMNVEFFKGFGAVAELSLLHFNSEGRETEFNEISDSFDNLSPNQTFTVKSRSLEQWHFAIPKVGLSYAYKWNSSKLYAAFKVGKKFGKINNSGDNYSVSNPYYSAVYTTSDVKVTVEAGTGSGWVAGFDLMYQLAPFKDKRLSFTGGLAFNKGSIQNAIIEKINDNAGNDNYIETTDMDFQTYGLKLGISYDLF